MTNKIPVRGCMNEKNKVIDHYHRFFPENVPAFAELPKGWRFIPCIPSAAVWRVIIRTNKSDYSVYFDIDQSCGSIEEPYYEVFLGYERGDGGCVRAMMDESKEIIDAIIEYEKNSISQSRFSIEQPMEYKTVKFPEASNYPEIPKEERRINPVSIFALFVLVLLIMYSTIYLDTKTASLVNLILGGMFGHILYYTIFK